MQANWIKYLSKDETKNLSFIGNRYHGAVFHDLSQHIDEELWRLFDQISHYGGFFYGRYDIKCSSIEDLKKRINFSILEFNGAGSIPNHIYAGKYSLMQAYKEIARHWKVLYQISSYNHKTGIQYWKVFKGARYLPPPKSIFVF